MTIETIAETLSANRQVQDTSRTFGISSSESSSCHFGIGRVLTPIRSFDTLWSDLRTLQLIIGEGRPMVREFATVASFQRLFVDSRFVIEEPPLGTDSGTDVVMGVD